MVGWKTSYLTNAAQINLAPQNFSMQAAEQGDSVAPAVITAVADGPDQAGAIDQADTVAQAVLDNADNAGGAYDAATAAQKAAECADNAGGALEMTNGPAVTLEAEGTDMIVESHQHYE